MTETIKALAGNDAETAPYKRVAFSTLSDFEFGEIGESPSVARAAGSRKLPERVRKLDGQKVRVDGFMMPLDFDAGRLTQFLLNGSYDMCAFGGPTRLNDFVMVRMGGGRRTNFTGHVPVSVFGTLRVSEERQGDRTLSLYRMEADFLGVKEEYLR